MPNDPVFRRTTLGCMLFSALLLLALFTHSLLSHSAPDNGWRRTNRGWQHVSAWELHEPLYNPPRTAQALHPAVVASFELCLATGSLLAFNSR